jgi:hypothetical protein
MKDFSYTSDGLFIMLMPNTPRAEEAYGAISEASGGTGKFLACHLPTIRYQLKKAGFTLGAAKKEPPISDDELLAILTD